MLNRLAGKLDGVTPADLEKRVDAGESRPFESVVVAQNVRPALAYYLAQRERQFPGVRLRDSFLRTYPEGRLAAHVLGGTGKISAEELDDYRGRGLARLLLERAFARDAAAGRAGTLLHVDTANTTPALDLYLSVGMRAVLAIDMWHGDLPTAPAEA